jgi:glucosamine--fructose-6-phosphate aminotransferase (isomerizing)
VLAVNNVVGSTIAREADGGIYQHVGPEVGVASTKAFTSQLLLGAMLALYIGRMRDLSFSDGVAYVRPQGRSRSRARGPASRPRTSSEIARRYARHSDMLFLGRLSLYSPSPSKARSSSRKSPTSMPRVIRRRR